MKEVIRRNPKQPAKLAIYERGMWSHMNNLADPALLTEYRARLDADSQAEAPLYGLGPLTFFEERISDPIPTMPGFVAILRRYRGAIVDPARAEFARNRKHHTFVLRESGSQP